MKRENSNLCCETTLSARPGQRAAPKKLTHPSTATPSARAGQLEALERWLQLNSGSFRQWPGLVDVAWARVAGRDSVCLKLTYESHVALEQNYDRWVAAAEMMERSFLSRAPSEPSVSAQNSPTPSPKSAAPVGAPSAADQLNMESPSAAYRTLV